MDVIRELIRDGWDYHETESERLAAELEASNLDELEDDLYAECLRLSNHTIGEHLADWSRARKFAEAVWRANRDRSHSALSYAHLAVARFMDGAEVAAHQAEIDSLLVSEDSIATYLTAKSLLASALSGSGRFVDAGLVMDAANRLAMGLDRSESSDRSMAAANNNLANDLLESEDLDSNGLRLMVECAEAAHMFWKRCGTWVNEERALYLLALVRNRLGNHQAGLQAAQSALRVIKKNGEEPVDEAFIHLAASVAFIGLSDIESAREQLANADALVESWSDESLVSWYQNERARVPVRTEGTKV